MFCLLQFTKLKDEFGAVYFDLLSSESDSDFEMLDYDCEGTVEGEWVNVVRTRSYKEAASVEITRNRGGFSSSNRSRRAKPERCFSSVISSMRLLGDDCLINFDTTALVALVSGITNGCAERIVNMPEIELEEKFKGNTVFDCSGNVLSGKRGMVCMSVLSEFKELVSIYAGHNEKLRAEQLLKRLIVVNDNPSELVVSLPTTRKLAMKNKTAFGTCDRWGAPTLTANMAFSRAVAQTGMSLSTIDHSSRALTGD